jgi:hypothetical protein
MNNGIDYFYLSLLCSLIVVKHMTAAAFERLKLTDGKLTSDPHQMAVCDIAK